MQSRAVRPTPPPQLHWLPAIPSWSERLGALGQSDDQAWRELVALAAAFVPMPVSQTVARQMTGASNQQFET